MMILLVSLMLDEDCQYYFPPVPPQSVVRYSWETGVFFVFSFANWLKFVICCSVLLFLTLRICYSSTLSFKTRPTNRLYMLRAKVLTDLPEGSCNVRRRARRAARKPPARAAAVGVSRPPQALGL